MSATGAPAPSSRRVLRTLLTLFAAVALFITLLAEHKDALEAIKRMDIAASDAAASVSIGALLGDFGDRFNQCTYRWLVICEPKPELGLLQSLAAAQITPPAQNTPPWLTLLTAIPRLPDALIYVSAERWKRGPLAFGALLVFLALNVLVIRIFLREGGPFLWILAGAGVPVIAALACFALKYAFLFATHTVLLVVQALLWIAGISAAVAWVTGTYLQGKEVVQTTKEVRDLTKLG